MCCPRNPAPPVTSIVPPFSGVVQLVVDVMMLSSHLVCLYRIETLTQHHTGSEIVFVEHKIVNIF